MLLAYYYCLHDGCTKYCDCRYARLNTSGRATNHASKKYGLIGQKNSTFFPSLAPTVKMEDDDADNDYDADFYSNNDTVTTVRPAVLNDAYYLEDEDVSDEEDVPVENRDGSVDLNVWTYDSSCLYLSH